MVETQHHLYETVLRRRDADQLADAVWDHVTEGGKWPLRAPKGVLLRHDARHPSASLYEFREHLTAALASRGLRPEVHTAPTNGRAPAERSHAAGAPS
jgi:hypothetical protein